VRILIIRTYPSDDYSAHLCYLTAKKHNVADKYIFWAEYGDNPLIEKTHEPIFYRQRCGNFGGLLFVKKMISDLTLLPLFKKDDHIIFSDADIIFLKNPFELIDDKIDHAGLFGKSMVCDNIPHVSGQLNIIKGWLWNKYIRGGVTLLDDLHKYQSEHNSVSGTADDTLFSIFSYLEGAKKKSFPLGEYWIHDKTNNKEEYYKNILEWT
jgi:hypothetical protein